MTTPWVGPQKVPMSQKDAKDGLGCGSYVEAEQEHLPVPHPVVPPLTAHQACLPGGLVRARPGEFLPPDGLRAHEPALEVRVDLAGGVVGRRAAAEGPGADLLVSDGEERLQAEQP